MPIDVKPVARFSREYKQLRKKYRQLQETVQSFVAQLQSGETPGDRIQDVHEALVYKVRLPNKDANKWKSGGFRIIYYVETVDGILLLTIYSKGDIENLSAADICQMVDEADSEIEND